MSRNRTLAWVLLAAASLAGPSARAADEPCRPVSRVKDLRPGAQGAFPASDDLRPAAIGDTIFFVADDGESGLELWKSNGTAAGTVRVKDLRPGREGSKPQALTVVGTTLFFTADDGAHGVELWKSDGTAAGTVLVQDVRSGAESSEPKWLTVMGGKLFFVADDGAHGRELWRSDGTEAGTLLLRDIDPGPTGPYRGVQSLATTGTVLYASVSYEDYVELWRSDGTPEGTRKVASPTPPRPFGSTDLGHLTPVGNTLFFTVTLAPEDFTSLWKTDGTEAGTVMIRNVSDFRVFEFVAAGGLLFFSVDFPQELWRSDGTQEGTYSLGRAVEGVRSLTAAGAKVYFVAQDAGHGAELYESDGRVIRRVKDIAAGSASSEPGALRWVDGRLLFTAADVSGNRKIWTTDGTETGTRVLFDLSPASPQSSWFQQAGSRIFFTATSPESGAELWSINDCAAPTLECPEPVTREATGPSGAAVSYPPARASGGASPPTIGYSHASGSTFPLGTTMVTATAEDDTGHRASCTFTVSVRDSTPPAVSCPPPQEAQATGEDGAAVDYPAATATDAVSPPSVSYSLATGSRFPVGITEVTVTAVDAAGNAASCAFTVTVSPLSPAPPEDGTPAGCGGCSASAPGSLAWVGLLLLWAMRRRGLRATA